MSTPEERPTVLVLGASAAEPPPGLPDTVGEEADLRFAATTAELVEGIPGADVVFVWDFRSEQLPEAWPRAERLRWIHVAAAGVDAVLFPALRDSEVVVTNSRGIFDDPIAEFVLMVMLVFTKDLLTTLELQQAHTWRHREVARLAGRRLLVVGAGPIGRAIARLARAAGVEVTGVARHAREEDPDFGRVLAAEGLHKALPDTDFVALAVPLTASTRHLIGPRELELLDPGAYLVNVARGPVVDERALITALEEGQIAGAALDVFETEPLPEDSPLWDMPQVLVSPHMSGDFLGWREALVEAFADNLRRWSAGQPLVNVVDKQRGYVPTEA